MKKMMLFLLLPLLLFASPQTIAVHNRPLIKLNGHTISLIDVMKKMNTYLYKNYPHAIGNKEMLYQFYLNNWRATLDEMINNELMLLEAETKEMTVTEGEIREEIEARYGPNVMANLENIDLTLEEAKELIRTELIVQRMMWLNVTQKALQDATPALVKAAYAAYTLANPPTDQWEYQVLTIRGENAELCEKIAKQAAFLSSKHSLDATKDLLIEQMHDEPEAPKITVSDDYLMRDHQLSDKHRAILNDLETNCKSAPIAQASQATGSTVWRVFHLKDHQVLQPNTFAEMHEPLKNQILNERYQHYSKLYAKKLREQYHIDNQQLDLWIPTSYTPFVMQ